jgi:indole-3-pyruvate monooxygenase
MTVNPTSMPAQSTVIQSQAIVIGAGPAGLAVGACLKRAGVPAIILEQSDQVASAWRRHYKRLHLHTDKAHSALPFVPFGPDFPRYPSRLQVIEYLEGYAQQMELQPRFGQEVIAARNADDHWQVQTQDAFYETRNLVVAAGYNREPNVPQWPDQASFHGPILHSSQYRDGEPYRDQAVLVVGFGNSGGEIAIDLWEHGARPSLAVRGAVNVLPRELFGIPLLTFAILQRSLPPGLADALNRPLLALSVGDIRRYGLRPLPQGPLAQIHDRARIPLIDVGTLKLIKAGHVAVRAGVERFTERGVVFADGTSGQFDAVILATGYRPRLNGFLQDATAVLDEAGTPRSSGSPGPIPGLYFCGYYVSPTGMLREIGLEAQRISAAITQQP